MVKHPWASSSWKPPPPQTLKEQKGGAVSEVVKAFAVGEGAALELGSLVEEGRMEKSGAWVWRGKWQLSHRGTPRMGPPTGAGSEDAFPCHLTPLPILIAGL